MVRKWYNTIVQRVSEMMDIDDDYILLNSKGEVSGVFDDEDPESIYHSTLDPDIFGELLSGKEREKKEESLNMGHITLPRPVVNIQYFLGRKPVLSKELKMSVEDLERVIYYNGWVVIDPKETEYTYKQVLSVKEYMAAAGKSDFVAMQGAGAIEELLKKEDVKDRQYMVLHFLPVLPISVRYRYFKDETSEHGGRYTPININFLYEGLIMKIAKLKRLQELGIPEIIIINEKNSIQRTVDGLISNGTHSIPFVSLQTFEPYDSLDTLYDFITSIHSYKPHWENHIDSDLLLGAYRTYKDYDETLTEDSYACDDPEMLKLEELRHKVNESLRSFVAEYVKQNHKRYINFMDKISNASVCNIVYTLDHWLCPVIGCVGKNGENHSFVTHRWYKEDSEESRKVIEEMLLAVERGIVKHVDLYIKKQLKWEM